MYIHIPLSIYLLSKATVSSVSISKICYCVSFLAFDHRAIISLPCQVLILMFTLFGFHCR